MNGDNTATTTLDATTVEQMTADLCMMIAEKCELHAKASWGDEEYDAIEEQVADELAHLLSTITLPR